MKTREGFDVDPRLRRALDEIVALVLARFPEATFEVARGYDPGGVYLRVFVDVDDLDLVRDTYMDRLLALQIDDALPVYVIPLLPRGKQASGIPVAA